jgi:SSS family solute:Na+ symporter
MVYPEVLRPFAFGTERGGDGMRAWIYARAFYGIVVCGSFAVIFTLWTRPEPISRIRGLVWGTIRDAEARFKGGPANHLPGRPVRLEAREVEGGRVLGDRWVVSVPEAALSRMHAEPGDLVHVSDRRWWLGGLRSSQAVLGDESVREGTIALPEELVSASGLRAGEVVRVEKIL